MVLKNRKTIFSLWLVILVIAACTPITGTSPVQSTATQVISTETPTTEATESATQVPATADGGVSVSGEGLCANAYYPVRLGATWNYASTGAGDYSFTDTITSVREDGFTLSTQSGTVAVTQEWACKSEGLTALQFGGAPAALLGAQGMQLNVQASNVSGVTFPNQISAGDQWQHSLDLEGSATVASQSGNAKGTARNNFTAVGMESVTVPAGTFDAMKIQVDTTINMTLSYQGLSLPVAFSGSYTYWFVQGVGWVKASGTGSIAGASFSETTELQSYNIP